LRTFLFSVGALFFYTIFNLLFARKLTSLAPYVAVPIYTTIVVIGSLSVAVSQWKTLESPSPEQSIWLILCGLCLLFADMCYVSAINDTQQSITLLTTVLCLLPVTVAASNALLTQTLPSKTQMIAMCMAIISVTIIAREQSQ
jgi:drug/metabolite transporter (DMT)-like permease